ncbi:MAG: Sua5/YciO/YrdC/YwlC family protein [Phycisphaerae bacterium]
MSNSPSTLPNNLLLQPSAHNIARTAKLLHDGHLVILPTETVYGIALNLLSQNARNAARALKGAAGGGANPQWVLHLPSPDDLLTWVPSISQIGRRLITKALPGPVAFQIKLTPEDAAAARNRLGDAANETISADNFMTFRVPELSPTQQVLADANVPIAIIGAGGPGGGGAAYEVADLPETLVSLAADPTPPRQDLTTDPTSPLSSLTADPNSPPRTPAPIPQITAILDAGRTRYRNSSTVVRLEGDQFHVVRPGVIDERIIQKMADFLLLFICSGNTCRSPMAAGIATRILADKLRIEPSELPLRHIVVQSAGVHAARGMRATREAVAAAKSLNADLGPHLSQPASVDLLRRADVIYTMTDAHREEILYAFPGAAKKTQRLDPEGDIDDPIGAGPEVYQQVAGHLADLLQHRLSELQL